MQFRRHDRFQGGILDSFRLRIHSPQTCPNCEATLPLVGNEARVPALVETHLRLDRSAGNQRSAKGLAVARPCTHANNGNLHAGGSVGETGRVSSYSTWVLTGLLLLEDGELLANGSGLQSESIARHKEIQRPGISKPTNPLTPKEGRQTRTAARARATLTYVSGERQMVPARHCSRQLRQSHRYNQ
jgi:hypothetical protein